jgi:hypothetical protein
MTMVTMVSRKQGDHSSYMNMLGNIVKYLLTRDAGQGARHDVRQGNDGCCCESLRFPKQVFGLIFKDMGALASNQNLGNRGHSKGWLEKAPPSP